jgi:2-polyprenyl-3-methyl-5-hydroxy-6-metoxy-1,4-benzoquinol methylase/predicted acetyltransferase
MEKGINYSWNLPLEVTDNKLEQMAELYSNHYGIWGPKGPHPGEHIKLSTGRLRAWIKSKDSRVAIAEKNGNIIGYAIAVQKSIGQDRIVSWVTQFVVHKDFRNKGIGKTLLFSIWCFSNHFAWGIVTSNPYAVRALEKTSNRRCVPVLIKQHADEIISEIGKTDTPFILEGTRFHFDNGVPELDTEFFVDRSDLEKMVKSVTAKDKEWLLGELKDGREWFAFTFKEQAKFKLTKSEFNEMLEISEMTARQAYGRMLLDKQHKWAAHTEKEIDFIIEKCGLKKSDKILDIGCGIGRHTNALAARGYNVFGIDYVENFIKRAEKDADENKLSSVFFHADARSYKFHTKFDFVLCLYDVIGSFVSDKDNHDIVKAIRNCLTPEGKALISVMNLSYSTKRAKPDHFFNIDSAYDKLLDLTASDTMETTGDIFNPDLLLIDNKTNVVYRKEQFKSGSELPVEVIVRDRRYTEDEIRKLCESNDLKIIWSRFVKSGDWDNNQGMYNSKEILLFCEKSDGQLTFL